MMKKINEGIVYSNDINLILNGYNNLDCNYNGIIIPDKTFIGEKGYAKVTYHWIEENAEIKKTVKDFEDLYKVIDGKIYVDLKNINKKQLVELGITKVDICPYCTCCNNEYFYSYRKENRTNLRHSAVLKLI